MRLPLQTYRARRAHKARLCELRDQATRHGWAVLGLTDDLSEHYVGAPLLGGLSAQAELACAGWYKQWKVLAAYVDTRALDSRHGGKPANQLSLLCVVHIGADDRQFVIAFGEHGPEAAALTPAAETGLEELMDSVVAAGDGLMASGDSVAAETHKLVLVHGLNPSTPRVPVVAYLDVLTTLATVMQTSPSAHTR